MGLSLKPCPTVSFVQTMPHFPLCRAEHWRFCRESPEGVQQGCRALLEGQESLPANPDKTARAQETSGIGSPFLWILSFGDAKESISPVGARTHIQTTVALATPYLPLTLTLSHKGRGNVAPFILRQAQDERSSLLISWFDKALLSAVEVLTTNGFMIIIIKTSRNTLP